MEPRVKSIFRWCTWPFGRGARSARALGLGWSGRHIRPDNQSLEEPMQHESSISGTWRALSDESARAIEKAGRAVVAVHARRRIPASGVHWRPGIVVTAD